MIDDEKYSLLVHRKSIIFHQNNARQFLWWPDINIYILVGMFSLNHNPPNIVSSDKHLLWSLQNSLRKKYIP